MSYFTCASGQFSSFNATNFCYPAGAIDNTAFLGFPVNGTCRTNCTEICTDPRLLFAVGPEIFAYCLRFTDNVNRAGGEYFKSDEFKETMQTTVELINTCMVDYCAEPNEDLGGCPYRNISFPGEKGMTVTEQFVKSGACNVELTATIDIAGPGLYAAYFMQIALIWILSLAFLGLTVWQKKEKKTAPKISKFIADRIATVESMMVEFQEAQCFFSAATQIAVLIAGVARPELFDASSQLQVDVDFQTSLVTAEVTLVCLSAGVIMLAFSNMLSRYTGILSCFSAAVPVTVVVFFLQSLGVDVLGANDNLNVDQADGFITLAKQKAIQSCGMSSPPSVYCGSSWTGLQSPLEDVIYIYGRKNDTALSLFSIVFFGGLVLVLTLVHAKLKERARTRTYWVLTIIGVCVHLGFICLCVNSLTVIKNRGSVNFEEWKLGQIVVVTTWAPFLFKWIYCTIGGIGNYSNIRFAQHFKVAIAHHYEAQQTPGLPAAGSANL